MKKLILSLAILTMGIPTFAEITTQDINDITIKVEEVMTPEIVQDIPHLPNNVLTDEDLITKNDAVFISLDFLKEQFGMELQLIKEGKILIMPTIDIDDVLDSSSNLKNEEFIMSQLIEIPEGAIKIHHATITNVDFEGKQITILPDEKEDLPQNWIVEDLPQNWIVLNISDETVFTDGRGSFEDMKVGMPVEVYHSPAMTSSLVPQTAAYIINSKEAPVSTSLPTPGYSVPAVEETIDPAGFDDVFTVMPEDTIRIARIPIINIDSETKQITLLPYEKEDIPQNWLILNTNEDTLFTNGNGKFEDMEIGMVVEVFHSSAMTRSLIPQTAAYMINPRLDGYVLPIPTVEQVIPEPVVQSYDKNGNLIKKDLKITEISFNGENMSIIIGTTPYDQEVFHITVDTTVMRDNKIIPASALQAGQIVDISVGPTMTMSLPPQFQAISIEIQ
ncbi:hypothetical protein AN641_07290 [Candidatus Epulonipiscioides gigas]|nr:hypothetical protein AN641_07290 [Epulopiscium sp. SCG-C07WGA-EpuloA2]